MDDAAPTGPTNLPEIPGGLNPELVLGRDIADLVSDHALNPSGDRFDRIGAARVSLALARARERVNVLDAEVRLAIAEAIERMRAEGRYVEYRSDERYQQVHGALTVGEETEWGGVRMFYLFPEEFPEIHEKRSEKAAIAERAVRELLSALSGESKQAAPAGEVPR